MLLTRSMGNFTHSFVVEHVPRIAFAASLQTDPCRGSSAFELSAPSKQRFAFAFEACARGRVLAVFQLHEDCMCSVICNALPFRMGEGHGRVL